MSDVQIQVVNNEDDIPQEPLLQIITGTELEEVIAELKQEYTQAKADFDARNKKIIKWRKNMEAVASDAPKNHPYKNASNVTIPVTQTITQSLFAQVRGTFAARDPLWTVTSFNTDEDEINKHKVIEKYLGILLQSPYDLGKQWLDDLIFEALLTGGAFPKVSYDINTWRVKDEAGGDREVVWHDGPMITVAPLERVIYRKGISSISRLPWIAVDYPLTEMELRERAAKGIYDPAAVEQVLAYKRTEPTDTEEQEQIAETYNSSQTTGLYDVSEVYFYHDVDGSGVPVDLFFTVHFDSGAVLKQQYNSLGARSIVSAEFVHRPQGLAGRGTGQMTESFQAEITTGHNLRIDNAKLSGMRMVAVRRGSMFGAKKEIYPGAVWEVENPREDVNALQLGEVYPSSLQDENMAWGLAQRAVGLSETQMGFSDPTLGTRDTARGQAMRMQRGDTIMGSAVEGLKTTISQIGMLVWMQCIANKDRVIARERQAMRLNQGDLALLEQALNMPITDVPLKMRFVVETTEMEKTYEQRRMNVMTLSQLFTQFATQTVPLAAQLFGPQGEQMQKQAPQLWQYMARCLTGSGKLMEDIFKFFGTYDTNNYIPDPEKLDQLLDMMAGMAQSVQGAGQVQIPGAQGQQGPMAQGQMPGGAAIGTPGAGFQMPAGRSGGAQGMPVSGASTATPMGSPNANG